VQVIIEQCYFVELFGLLLQWAQGVGDAGDGTLQQLLATLSSYTALGGREPDRVAHP